jgi:hypothetical protein
MPIRVYDNDSADLKMMGFIFASTVLMQPDKI